MMGCASTLHAAALDEIREALDESSSPYMACSGGKDSMLLAHLVLEVDPAVPIVHSLHGARWLPSRWPGVLVQALEAMGARDIRTTRSNLIYTPTSHDLVFVGLRRAESQRRRKRMDTVGQLNPQVREVWPLADWPDAALWGCTDAHEVPVASIYSAAYQRFHWPSEPIDRGPWSRITYTHVPPPAVPWMVDDPVLGPLCGECGALVSDPDRVEVHSPGCWVPDSVAHDRLVDSGR